MDFKTTIQTRHATRWFTDQQIPPVLLQDLVKLAQGTPSWVNSQPVRAYIATGKKLAEIRAQHTKLSQDPDAKTDPSIPLRPRNEWDEAAQANMQNWMENDASQAGEDWPKLAAQASGQLFNAQAIVYLTLAKDYSNWSLVDLGAFSQSLMLAASAEEIDSLPAYEFTKFNQPLREALNIPGDQELIYGIGLGYADQTAAINKIKASRMDPTDVITFLD
ncbi:nitroreductase [Leuconostocaceae bacterium ESL0723]|nr:nitroreductase [Leuconostocaceae bacterium ESL0723]